MNTLKIVESKAQYRYVKPQYQNRGILSKPKNPRLVRSNTETLNSADLVFSKRVRA